MLPCNCAHPQLIALLTLRFAPAGASGKHRDLGQTLEPCLESMMPLLKDAGLEDLIMASGTSCPATTKPPTWLACMASNSGRPPAATAIWREDGGDRDDHLRS